MVTMEEIRAKYPNPQSAEDLRGDGDECYCVGGAVCWTAKHWTAGFPPSCSIAVALCKLNPNLKYSTASTFGQSIIAHNDDGKFDEAWAIVREALTYGQAS